MAVTKTKDKELKQLQDKNKELSKKITEQKKIIEKLEKYKTKHPIKVGNIGGNLINEDTIIALEKQIKSKDELITKLQQEIKLQNN